MPKNSKWQSLIDPLVYQQEPFLKGFEQAEREATFSLLQQQKRSDSIQKIKDVYAPHNSKIW